MQVCHKVGSDEISSKRGEGQDKRGRIKGSAKINCLLNGFLQRRVKKSDKVTSGLSVTSARTAAPALTEIATPGNGVMSNGIHAKKKEGTVDDW